MKHKYRLLVPQLLHVEIEFKNTPYSLSFNVPRIEPKGFTDLVCDICLENNMSRIQIDGVRAFLSAKVGHVFPQQITDDFIIDGKEHKMTVSYVEIYG